MHPFLLPPETQQRLARTLAIIRRRPALATRALGLVALCPRLPEEFSDALLNEALALALTLPEQTDRQLTYKARTLFHMTATLARLQYTKAALQVAPHIPLAPGTAEVLEFEPPGTRQFYQWRVDPARALVAGRLPKQFSVRALSEPYRRGMVTIDHEYIRTSQAPKLITPQPILLLPHPHGLVQIPQQPQLVILDGNHRVVWAWLHRRLTIPGIILTPDEARAILLRYTLWPPYGSWQSAVGRRQETQEEG